MLIHVSLASDGMVRVTAGPSTAVEDGSLSALVDVPVPAGSAARSERGRYSVAWATASVLGGLILVEGAREGGFWRPDALVVAVIALVALLAQVFLSPPDRQSWWVTGGLFALAAAWLVRAATGGTPGSFLPFGASVLGFAATFVAVRALNGSQQAVAASFMAVVGMVGAAIGWAGLIWRWYPMAIPTQRLWRLSSTLTYSDAAGMVLAVCLLVALAGGPKPWISRLAVYLCAGGVVAAQSRGALVALACALVLIPRRQFVTFLVPVLAGVGLGIVAVASSTSTTPVPWLSVVVVVGALGSLLWTPNLTIGARRDSGGRNHYLVMVAFVIVIVAVTGIGLHHEIALRVASPSDQDRAVEWSAALHQFMGAPLYGVGPDRLLQFHAADGTYAHFAHNEYLQMAADIGLVGLALLAAIGASLARIIRRVDVLTSCATAALVCWAVAGAVDFDWHLTVVGLLGGWVAGLAAGPSARVETLVGVVRDPQKSNQGDGSQS